MTADPNKPKPEQYRAVLEPDRYGVLFEETYPGMRPGRLMGHNIDHNGNYTLMPVPYMKMEAIAILEHHKSLKTLPVPDSGNHQPDNEDEDW